MAGHSGMVGSAIVRLLQRDESVDLITANRASLDLANQSAVDAFFAEHSIDHVYLAGAKVGGIHANSTYPADFLYQNLMIQSNVIQAAHKSGVEKLLFLGSSCIYPKMARQPIREIDLLTGSLEPTNEAYAIAKIAGLKLCESMHRQYGHDFRAVMPTNLYGRNDNFHPVNSHVIPALMRRIHEAKLRGDSSVAVWGSGSPLREFLSVDDMAEACVYVMGLSHDRYRHSAPSPNSFLNVGTGMDCSIKDLAELLKSVIGFSGAIEFDTTKPDGTPRKLLDVTRLGDLGWRSRVNLEDGLTDTYKWFVDAYGSELNVSADEGR